MALVKPRQGAWHGQECVRAVQMGASHSSEAVAFHQQLWGRTVRKKKKTKTPNFHLNLKEVTTIS